MFKNYKYFLKKDFLLNIFIVIELIIVYVVLNLSLSLIILSLGLAGGQTNNEAVGLFSYIALACIVLYLFTVAISRMVNHQKNLQYYVNCISLGGTKKMIFWLNVLKTTIIYGISFVIAFVITLPLDIANSASSGLRFFTYQGQAATLALFFVMYAINILIDLATIGKIDLLKYLREGGDNE
ncbi:MAG: hypothetical protein RR123_05375 [Clostridia bacterium]